MVSIVVPVFNVEAYVEKCIESLKNQTYQDIEIVLVDDGSNDNSGKICDAYSSIDYRIKVIHQSNQGLVAARKIGIDNATGQYICIVDSDDWVEMDYVENLLNEIETEQADMVQSGYYREATQVKSIYCNDCNCFLNEKKRAQIIEEWLINQNAEWKSYIFAKIFRSDFLRECYKKIQGQYSLGEDILNFIFNLETATKLSSINYCGYHYRVRNNSLSHSKSFSYLENDINLTIEIKNLVKGLFPGIDENILENWFTWRMINSLKNSIDDNISELRRYVFQDVKKLKNKRVVIFGAGDVGKDFYEQIAKYEAISVVAWIDSDYANKNFEYANVESPDVLNKIDYDTVIIAIWDKNTAQSISVMLTEKYNIKTEKIISDYARKILYL